MSEQRFAEVMRGMAVCPPLEGVKFEIVDSSRFRGRKNELIKKL